MHGGIGMTDEHDTRPVHEARPGPRVRLRRRCLPPPALRSPARLLRRRPPAAGRGGGSQGTLTPSRRMKGWGSLRSAALREVVGCWQDIGSRWPPAPWDPPPRPAPGWTGSGGLLPGAVRAQPDDEGEAPHFTPLASVRRRLARRRRASLAPSHLEADPRTPCRAGGCWAAASRLWWAAVYNSNRRPMLRTRPRGLWVDGS